MSHSKSGPIVIKLPDDAGIDEAHDLVAYVVNGGGKVVDTVPFEERVARLTVSKETLRGSRLFVGSRFPASYPHARIDAYALSQAGAYQVSASTGKNNEIAIQRLPSQIIVRPPIHFCEVQGNVSNNLTINGVPQNGPVCQARVHICTVDWYYRWPIWLRPVIPPPVLAALQESVVALRAKRGTSASLSSAVAAKPIPAQVETQILSATPETIHGIVSDHSALLYPYFCAWPIFWPWFYRVVEQEVVYTDCNGHFDGWLVGVGTPAAENIYVWVEASIGGAWQTVFKPPFPCNTWWNYACGTEIDITLNDPAIAPCNCDAPVVDGSVWFTAIGSYGIASNIQQDQTSLYSPANIYNVGCTNLFDTNQLCPFGSDLGLYLAFGPTRPATHYRWSWTAILDSSMNAIDEGPNPITGTVERYYLWPLANGSWETGSVPLLDTDSGGNIAYLVPDYDVTTYPGVSAEAEWASFNFLSAALDSTKISNGYVVRLDLELLNVNSGTGLFEVVSVPVSTFQISNDTNAAAAYDGSMPAPYTTSGSGNNYLTLDPAVPGNALSFSLKVRVDNAAVTASIDDAWLLDSGGNKVPGGNSGPCGFIQFTDTSQDVSLSFVASEPFNFATFGYSVTKGNSGTAIVSAGGYVFANAPPFTLSGGVFSDAPSVASLLGTCSSAAFAELLTVASLATDGSSRLSQAGAPYYAEETNAFALTPVPT